MMVLKIDEGRAILVRNKRKGKILIAKRVRLESVKNRCIWCALRFSSVCIHLLNPKNPCDDFLPDHVFFEDNGNKYNTDWRRESKNDPK
jgi:hypothetical protein